MTEAPERANPSACHEGQRCGVKIGFLEGRDASGPESERGQETAIFGRMTVFPPCFFLWSEQAERRKKEKDKKWKTNESVFSAS